MKTKKKRKSRQPRYDQEETIRDILMAVHKMLSGDISVEMFSRGLSPAQGIIKQQETIEIRVVRASD